ncbi:MAG: cytochrome b/b6 domain-containing protein, partial [Pontixanthobacter sp.]
MGNANQSRYSKGAMLFHWVIAIAVITNWRLADAAEHVTRDEKMWWMAQHKALGITILVLTLGRLAWRWAHPVPPLPNSMQNWERILARSIHVIFYVILIGLPLGGWLGVSLYGS